jgi:hypothetical protein
MVPGAGDCDNEMESGHHAGPRSHQIKFTVTEADTAQTRLCPPCKAEPQVETRVGGLRDISSLKIVRTREPDSKFCLEVGQS